MRVTRGRTGAPVRTQRRAGFGLIELMICFTLVVVALMGFSNSIISSMLAGDRNAEVRLATEAARATTERMRGAPFDQVFALYNSDPLDDPGPGGPGSAPGSGFGVLGLDPVEGDPDGLVGRVLLPEAFDLLGGSLLREDLNDPDLGLPRDLSGDGLVDGNDHSGGYVLLPVIVRVEWGGAGGEVVVEFESLLGEF